ncbi:MAG: hypothetical protein JWN04_3845 [Myxococcaceae bacterium]|nr:hypothetical protein [Myxococcaceae bacterium]
MSKFTSQDVAEYQAMVARLEPIYAKLGLAFDDEDSHMVHCMRVISNRIAAASGCETRAEGNTWEELNEGLAQPGSQTAHAEALGKTIQAVKAKALPQRDIGDAVADLICGRMP